MDALNRLTERMSKLERPSRQELLAVLLESPLKLNELAHFLPLPSIYPYGRKVICRTQHVELLVMNWAHNRECAPHDHGNAWGWVSVLDGQASHVVYKLDSDGMPVVRKKVQKGVGTTFFAPEGLIHSMGNPTPERLVTLHAYAPPITGMRVYDLHRCAACVVSDECGAWWPESQRQIVQQIRLKSLVPDADEV